MEATNQKYSITENMDIIFFQDKSFNSQSLNEYITNVAKSNSVTNKILEERPQPLPSFDVGRFELNSIYCLNRSDNSWHTKITSILPHRVLDQYDLKLTEEKSNSIKYTIWRMFDSIFEIICCSNSNLAQDAMREDYSSELLEFQSYAQNTYNNWLN